MIYSYYNGLEDNSKKKIFINNYYSFFRSHVYSFIIPWMMMITIIIKYILEKRWTAVKDFPFITTWFLFLTNKTRKSLCKKLRIEIVKWESTFVFQNWLWFVSNYRFLFKMGLLYMVNGRLHQSVLVMERLTQGLL